MGAKSIGAIVSTNTAQDIVDFNKYTVRRRARWLMIKQQAVAGFCVGGVVFLLVRDELEVAFVTSFLAFLVPFAHYPSFQYAKVAHQLKRAVKNDPDTSYLGRHRLAIEPEGLRETSDSDETFSCPTSYLQAAYVLAQAMSARRV